MKKIKRISENINYSAVDIGALDRLMEHSLTNPRTMQKVEGKVFLKGPSKATGTEISFQVLPPKTEIPFFHIHKKNEETYIIIKGKGLFQVDDDCFAVSEGSVIRIAPEGKRSLCNSSDYPLIYMVIQSKAGSLEEYTNTDGSIVAMEPKWK